MRPRKAMRRRSFLGLVAGAGVIGGALPLVGGKGSAKSRGSLNGGNSRRQNPITDGDKNPSDITGPRGCTDYDVGPRADPPQSGRGSGLNDNDRESGRPRARQYGDPTNCGRRRNSRR